MSVIAVRNIPISKLWNMRKVMLELAKYINGQFDGLHLKRGKSTKTAYLRLSEKLDPIRVVEIINRQKAGKKKVKLMAFIPDVIPDLPVPKSFKKKKQAELGPPQPPDQVLFLAHHEILVELQSKYTELYKLSKSNDHKLMKEIAKTVFERLRHILNTNAENAKTPFILSKTYRKSYPHFADFQLVLSTLHCIEDAAGTPRTQLLEHELTAPSYDLSAHGEIPYEKVVKTCQKYSNKIEVKVTEYINGLKTDIEPENATPEELARHRVRVELKNILPYMGPMLRQVVTTNFACPTTPSPMAYIRMKIYGEPYLPTRDHLEPVMKKFDAFKILRADHICNMVRFTIIQRHYSALMKLDGTELGGAKLVIRKSVMETYKVPEVLIKELKALLSSDREMPEPEMNDEDMEDWGEEL
ncbi:unnamed protein product [Diatraea saccharalis]|uniref:Uncharacterized protein n=1 Tax=Diatraea saccharalis TaxID=40085 RepID=A0A9N9R5Q9_9NEOP|nr:unnamed protein product [Diatraea saccharalis]